MRVRSLPVLLMMLTLGCVGPKRDLASASLDPVHFTSGSSSLADGEDYMRVGEAVQRMRQDPRVYLLIRGWTDGGTSEAKAMAVSQARADYVRQLVMDSGWVESRRVVAKGMGMPDGAKRRQPQHRMVEFDFF